LLDVSALHGARAGRALVTAAKHDVKNAPELVVLLVANLYLNAVFTAARAETAQAALEIVEIFRLLGIMFLILIPLVFLMKRPAGRSGPAAAH